jgi:hypothetical protein
MQLALTESLGFMKDIPDEEWNYMKAIARGMEENSGDQQDIAANLWYERNWEPSFSCRFQRRVGGLGDGAKWVCDPHRIAGAVQRRGGDSCLVYSVGSSGNFMFEVALQEFLGNGSICQVHIFDFGDFREDAQQYADLNIHYHQWGITGSYNETTNWLQDAYLESNVNHTLKTLEETMKVLGHSGQVIDIFKIDCEGCEWSTYKDWLTVDIRQIQVELHYLSANTNEFFVDLKKAGFAPYDKEPNLGAQGECIEYAFIKLDPSFLSE